MERSLFLGHFAVCMESVPKAAKASQKAAGAVNGLGSVPVTWCWVASFLAGSCQHNVKHEKSH